MTPEGRVKKQVMKYLKGLSGGYFWKIQDRFTAGIPDIIGVLGGRFVAIEVKAPGEPLRPLQAVVLDILENCGGVVGVAESEEDAKKIIRSVYVR